MGRMEPQFRSRGPRKVAGEEGEKIRQSCLPLMRIRVVPVCSFLFVRLSPGLSHSERLAARIASSNPRRKQLSCDMCRGQPGCRVYVGNLSWEAAWQDLKDHMRGPTVSRSTFFLYQSVVLPFTRKSLGENEKKQPPIMRSVGP
jgi:hypothetical protein